VIENEEFLQCVDQVIAHFHATGQLGKVTLSRKLALTVPQAAFKCSTKYFDEQSTETLDQLTGYQRLSHKGMMFLWVMRVRDSNEEVLQAAIKSGAGYIDFECVLIGKDASTTE
jgi:hypothetical protein